MTLDSPVFDLWRGLSKPLHVAQPGIVKILQKHDQAKIVNDPS